MLAGVSSGIDHPCNYLFRQPFFIFDWLATDLLQGPERVVEKVVVGE